MMGMRKVSEKLTYVREIEKIEIVDCRKETNKKGYNISL